MNKNIPDCEDYDKVVSWIYSLEIVGLVHFCVSCRKLEVDGQFCEGEAGGGSGPSRIATFSFPESLCEVLR